MGILVPKPGFWSVSDDPWTSSDTKWHIAVVECLTDESCIVADATASTPNATYSCNATKGYKGTLCATCRSGFFWKNKACRKCDSSALNSSAQIVIGVLSGTLVVWVGLKLCMSKRAAKKLIASLHHMRIQTTHDRKRVRRRRKRLRGHMSHNDDDDASGGASWFVRWALWARVAALRAAHRFVKTARDNQLSLGESSKIVINAAKVISHLARESFSLR